MGAWVVINASWYKETCARVGVELCNHADIRRVIHPDCALRSEAISCWNVENIHRALEVVGDGGEVDLSSVLQFSAKVGFENSLVGGPFISFCRG